MSKISIEGNASGTGTITIAAPNTNSNATLTLPTASGTVVTTAGAQTIEFAAGTAGAPSITFTGDTNTGIFSPAADTIAFSEGGAEAMRIDSSGRVGIGTTSPATLLNVSSATTNAARLRVTGTGSTGGNYRGYEFGSSGGFSGGIFQDESTSALSFWSSSGGASATIDSSGNVGIGVTPSASWGTSNFKALQIKNGSAAAQSTSDLWLFANAVYDGSNFKYVSNNPAAYYRIDAGEHFWTSATSGIAGNNITFTERARITSGGYFKASNNGTYVSSTGPYHEFQSNATGNVVIWARNSSADPYGYFVDFTTDPNNATNYVFAANSGGNLVYRIFTNGTTSARSDAKWKKNIETARDGYIDDLARLRVVKYNWYNHEDGTPKEMGLIAQEVEQVFPGLVQEDEEKRDEVRTREIPAVLDEDGNEVEPARTEEYTEQVGTGEYTKSIKFSVFTPMLIKAVQELKAITDTQAQTITALEARIAALETGE